jgi:hypothetical protein
MPKRFSDDTIKQKLKHYSVKDRKTRCREWTGALSADGYGATRYDKRRQSAHRVAYTVYVGPIPPGTVVHHICGNKKCIYVGHLQAVTPAENSAEMLERNYYLKRIAELEERLAKHEECDNGHDR